MATAIPNIGNLNSILGACQIFLILICFIIPHLHHSKPYILDNMLIVTISYLLIKSISSLFLNSIMIQINDPFEIMLLKYFQDKFS